MDIYEKYYKYVTDFFCFFLSLSPLGTGRCVTLDQAWYCSKIHFFWVSIVEIIVTDYIHTFEG